MRRLLPFSLPTLALFLAVGLAAPALGQGAGAASDVFTVRGVAVDVTADSASRARAEAHRRGQRLAYERLLDRITPKANHAALPKLSDDEISGLVESFEVNNEKTSSVRYIADLTVTFKRGEVRALLRARDISFAETRSKPVLVLPIFEAQGRVTLWEDATPWLAAWSRHQAADALVPVRVPLGDLTDISSIGADQALTGNRAVLDRIARRYGADDAMVVFARLSGPFAPGVEMSVTTSRYGPGGLDQTTVDTLQAVPDETFESFLARAVGTVSERIEERWKRDNLLDFDRLETLAVKALFKGLDEWLAIRQRLARVALVGRTDIAYLSRGEAGLKLSFFGDPEQLQIALAQADLALAPGATAWELTLAAGAAAAVGQR